MFHVKHSTTKTTTCSVKVGKVIDKIGIILRLIPAIEQTSSRIELTLSGTDSWKTSVLSE